MEQEIDNHTINKYVEGLHKLSIVTGKLDSMLLYLEQIKSEDRFLLSSLDSILKFKVDTSFHDLYKFFINIL